MAEPIDPRARFEARLRETGLQLSTEESDGVYSLASWMREGLERLDAALPAGDDADEAERALDLSLFEQGNRIREGRITSEALVRACLKRIEVRDPTYQSFYVVDRDGALEAAREADRMFAEGIDAGHLHGIPVAIKDLIDVRGMATTANAPGRKDAVAEADAEAVKRLREGGAVIIGKLATYEWGTVGPDKRGLFPPARNPWNVEHITGGSSSGNAAAVAGGLVRTTIGTDTGGSLRGPAFYCGVVGLKPTFDAVARDGVLPMSDSMDHVGPISRTVAEAAATLDALTHFHDERNASRLLGKSVKGLRVGYVRDWFARDPQAAPEVVAAVDAAMSTLSQLGMVVEEAQLPDYPAVEVMAAAILHRESFDYHSENLRERPEDFGRRAFLSLAAGIDISDAELEAARAAGATFRRDVDALLDRHDVVVTAGALTTALPAAPFEKEAVWTPMRTIGFNVSGHPVLALPIGFHDGLPIGMQVIGRYHDEARIVQVGQAFEAASDVSPQTPPLP
jgi:aspartyl-tRNA(Asn)/glutamyl-tRNA(Gln) amidotransferase subunit A